MTMSSMEYWRPGARGAARKVCFFVHSLALAIFYPTGPLSIVNRYLSFLPYYTALYVLLRLTLRCNLYHKTPTVRRGMQMEAKRNSKFMRTRWKDLLRFLFHSSRFSDFASHAARHAHIRKCFCSVCASTGTAHLLGFSDSVHAFW